MGKNGAWGSWRAPGIGLSRLWPEGIAGQLPSHRIPSSSLPPKKTARHYSSPRHVVKKKPQYVGGPCRKTTQYGALNPVDFLWTGGEGILGEGELEAVQHRVESVRPGQQLLVGPFLPDAS